MEAVRPSQVYLDESKLRFVIDWFNFESPNYDPLPVRKLDGRWTLTEGHTRAFVAYLSRAEQLRVVGDTDDISIPVYEQCVAWCENEGVTEIEDFAGRVVTNATFEEEWVERCQSL